MARLIFAALLLIATPAAAQVIGYGPPGSAQFIIGSETHAASDAARWLSIGADPRWYGDSGTCNGDADDTAAFTRANSDSKTLRISGTCKLNAWTPLNGTRIVATHPAQGYGDINSTSGVLTDWLVAASGAQVVVNLTGVSHFASYGVNVDCLADAAGRSGGFPIAYSGGGSFISLRDGLVTRCGVGLGFNTGVNSWYTETPEVIGTIFAHNYIGMQSLQDARIIGGSVSSNDYDGIYLSSGSFGNSIVGTRIEWNGGFGIRCFQAGRLTVTGAQFDSDALGGVYFNSCTSAPIVVSGGYFKRNGSNNVFPDQAHILINNSSNITISGVSTWHDKNDDGTGIDRPLYSVILQGTNSNIKINGNDWSGNTSGSSFNGTLAGLDGTDLNSYIRIVGHPNASHTGDTNEANLAAIKIPAGLLGANSEIRVTTEWTLTSSANNKSIIVRYSATSGSVSGTDPAFQNVPQTTNTSYRTQVQFGNNGATGSQIAASTGINWVGGTASSSATGSIDTTADTYVNINTKLASGSDTATLVSYVVEVIRQP